MSDGLLLPDRDGEPQEWGFVTPSMFQAQLFLFLEDMTTSDLLDYPKIRALIEEELRIDIHKALARGEDYDVTYGLPIVPCRGGCGAQLTIKDRVSQHFKGHYGFCDRECAEQYARYNAHPFQQEDACGVSCSLPGAECGRCQMYVCIKCQNIYPFIYGGDDSPLCDTCWAIYFNDEITPPYTT